ncbi:MAG: substrate-binding domain-containing protein [Anaerolineae bacterium]|nr:substrate-binding domain-containing protein [Anaerolineae bacterium]
MVIGREIAVTGFDDIPMAEHSHPPLTTVHQPIYRIGKMVRCSSSSFRGRLVPFPGHPGASAGRAPIVRQRGSLSPGESGSPRFSIRFLLVHQIPARLSVRFPACPEEVSHHNSQT